MRGEYGVGRMVGKIYPELPPRARRIPWGLDVAVSQYGTTSACAENTYGQPYLTLWPRNYLRVRGEYLDNANYSNVKEELPPRARRIPTLRRVSWCVDGTTSACAENTL